MTRVGVYLGNGSDSTDNVRRVITSWGKYLSSEFELDGFGAAELPDTASEYYNLVRTEQRNAPNPFTKVWSAYEDGREYIRRRNPDIVVQLWRYKTHGPGVALAAQAFGVRSLVRYTGDTFNEYKGVPWPKKAGIFALDHGIGRVPPNLADGLIALGPHGKRQLCEHGANPNRVKIIPPPRDPENQFIPAADKQKYKHLLGLPTNRPIALFVGRLTRMKGMKFLQTVIEKVIRERDMIFVLLGEGPYRATFSDTFPEEAIRMPGFVQNKRIHEYYKAAEVYVHPSPYEGLPLVILEALESRIPVVARNAGDISFVIPNTHESVDSFAHSLIMGDWTFEWKNRQAFNPEWQKNALVSFINETIE